MLRSKLALILGVSYLFAISIGLLIPKSVVSWGQPNNFFSRFFHDALYASPTVYLISNTLLFIPTLLILMYLIPKVQLHYLVFACSAGSIFVEFAQIKIPGRVSSVIDIVLNIFGMVVTLLALQCWPGLAQWIRGSESAR
jgi:hypothetical protein